MISSVLVVGNDSPNAARHPMRFFSGRMRSATIFSNSSSVTVDLLHTSFGLGIETEDMAEAVAGISIWTRGGSDSGGRPQFGSGAMRERHESAAAADLRQSSWNHGGVNTLTGGFSRKEEDEA